MANIAEIVIRATDEATNVINDIASNSGVSSKQMVDAFKGASLAISGLGVAGLAVLETTRAMSAEFGMLSMQLGISSSEMTALATETANVTFPLVEVQKTFDLLVRSGVECTAEMQQIATAFDTLGDATGFTASEISATLIPAFNAFGLCLTEVEGKTDMFTLMSRESLVTMNDFGRMMRYVAPEVEKMGITMEDSVAVLMALSEQGITGAAATREFRSAISAADGDQALFLASLGLTEAQLQTYRTEIENADGMTNQFAGALNEQYGIMATLKSTIDETKLSLSGYLAPLEGVMVGMTTAAPIVHALAGAQQLLNAANLKGAKILLTKLKVALLAVKAKMLLLLIPIKLVIAKLLLFLAPALLVIGVLYLLEKHFGVLTLVKEKVVAAFSEMIAFFETVVTTGIQQLQIVFETVFAAVKHAIETNVAIWQSVIDSAISTIVGVFNGLMGIAGIVSSAFAPVLSLISAPLNSAISFLRGLVSQFLNAGRALGDAFTNGISATISKAVDRARAAAREIRNLLPFSDAKEGPLSDLTESGESLMRTFAKGIDAGAHYPQQAFDMNIAGEGAMNVAKQQEVAAVSEKPMTIILQLDGKTVCKNVLKYMPGQLQKMGAKL